MHGGVYDAFGWLFMTCMRIDDNEVMSCMERIGRRDEEYMRISLLYLSI